MNKDNINADDMKVEELKDQIDVMVDLLDEQAGIEQDGEDETDSESEGKAILDKARADGTEIRYCTHDITV